MSNKWGKILHTRECKKITSTRDGRRRYFGPTGTSYEIFVDNHYKLSDGVAIHQIIKNIT